MASQQKNESDTVGVVASIWKNWVQLDPTKRNQVASQLGTLGHLLTIAANVQNFAQNAESAKTKNANSQASATPSQDEDDDIIEVEFEEVKK